VDDRSKPPRQPRLVPRDLREKRRKWGKDYRARKRQQHEAALLEVYEAAGAIEKGCGDGLDGRVSLPEGREDEEETETVTARCVPCMMGSTGEPGEPCSQCGRPMEPMFEGA